MEELLFLMWRFRTQSRLTLKHFNIDDERQKRLRRPHGHEWMNHELTSRPHFNMLKLTRCLSDPSAVTHREARRTDVETSVLRRWMFSRWRWISGLVGLSSPSCCSREQIEDLASQTRCSRGPQGLTLLKIITQHSVLQAFTTRCSASSNGSSSPGRIRQECIWSEVPVFCSEICWHFLLNIWNIKRKNGASDCKSRF